MRMGILDCLADAKTDGNAALTDNSENNAKIDKFAEYVAEHIRFGSNIRAGAEYREIICRVLTRRAVTQSLDICEGKQNFGRLVRWRQCIN